MKAKGQRWVWVIIAGMVLYVFAATGCASMGDFLRVKRTGPPVVQPKPQPTAEHLESRRQAAAALRDSFEKVFREGAEAGRSLWAWGRKLGNALVADLGVPLRALTIPSGQDVTAVLSAAYEGYLKEVEKHHEVLAGWEEEIEEQARKPVETETVIGSPLLGKALLWKGLAGAFGVLAGVLGFAVKAYAGKAGFLGKAVGEIVRSVQAARNAMRPEESNVTKKILAAAQSPEVGALVKAVKAGFKAGQDQKNAKR